MGDEGNEQGRLGFTAGRGWTGPSGLQLQEAQVAGWGALGVSLFSLPNFLWQKRIREKKNKERVRERILRMRTIFPDSQKCA